MISPPKLYAPVGYCIYCGKDDVPLTDEHIIAYGLGGNFVLPAASCKSCAKQTGRLEQMCLRQIMRPFRLKRGIPDKPRHKKDQPKELPLEMFAPGQPPQIHMVSVADFPEALALPRYPLCPLYQGLPVNTDITVTTQVMIFDGPLKELHEKYGATVFRLGVFNPIIFAQMLAKIAHSYVIANETRPFKPLLRDMILKGQSPLYFVGSEPEVPPVTDEKCLHQLEHRHTTINGRAYVDVRMRLFAGLATPRYIVPVGELS